MNLTRPNVALETKAPRRRATILAPFRFHDFRLLWFGLLISNLGTWMQITTLGYLVVALAPSAAKAALYVGLLGASSAVPVVLLSPIAGVVADRFPRRRVLVITNSLQALTALVLALLVTFNVLQLWEIFVLAGLRSTTQAFDAPARQSWVPLLVPREYIGNAIGLNSLAFNAPSVVGPPIAGFLILGVGPQASFYINAVTTLAVIVALVFMAPSAPSSTVREGVFASILAGVRFLFEHSVLRGVVLLLLVTCLLVRPFQQLLPAYAAHVVFVDARGLGVLLAATGWLFVRDLITAETQTLCWMAIFFFASAAASSAYLTVSETFPLEIRALAIAFFYAVGTGLGGIVGPWLFGVLIDTGSRASVFGGYLLGAVLMILGGLVAWRWGVAAERKPLEMVARPLTFID